MQEVIPMRKLACAAALAAAVVCLRAPAAGAEPTDVGVVKVSTEPAGAMVYVDGAVFGPTPVLFELEPGKHTLIVTRDGYAPITHEVVVRKEKITRTSVRLGKDPGRGIRVHDTRGADAGPGTITIATEPEGLTVFLGEVQVPLATPVAFDYKAGVYELRLEKDGKVLYRKTVFVRAGEVTEIDVDLARRRQIDESDPWQ
jgi:hypothetical protein